MANSSEPEVIHRQMQAQRAALGEKLETLENRIIQTVENAREAVAETVQTVKDGVNDSMATVQSSVAAVRETLDLPLQAQRRPWLVFGGSVVAGFAAGCLLRRAGDAAPSTRSAGFSSRVPATAPVLSEPKAERGETWVQAVTSAFAPEVHQLMGVAVGTLMGVLRDAVTEPLPPYVQPHLREALDRITTKLGGQTVQSDELQGLLSTPPKEANGRHNGAAPSYRG